MQVKIEQDLNAESPREEFDHLGKMICFHRRYNLGDKHEYRHENYSGWDAMEKALRKNGAAVVIPLYLFDHGGITISAGCAHFRQADSAGWDWGQVGFIVAYREDILKEYSRKILSQKLLGEVEKLLLGEVTEYDQFLTGEVYGYVIEDEEGERLDSCWGFYGREYCEQEANDALKHLEGGDR